MAAFAVDSLRGEFRRRQRRFLGKFLIGVEFALDARVDFGFFLRVPQIIFGEIFLVERDGIARLPVIEHFLGHVFGGVVLRVAFHAHGLHFDQHGAASGAALLHRVLGGVVNGHHIVAVGDHAANAVGVGAVGKIAQRNLLGHRRRVSPLIVFERPDQRRLLRRGQIQPS